MAIDHPQREAQQLKALRSMKRAGPNAQKPVRPIQPRTTRLTVNLPMELVNRLRDTVYWVPQLTVTRLVEDAIRAALATHEASNQGLFPRRTEELKPGRPRTERTAERETQVSRLRTALRSLKHRFPFIHRRLKLRMSDENVSSSG